ncbi:protein ImuA [Loktanella fryxellensis]|uniref:Protein ImuA n=1 Tax=Loktanella fryxellensis TaxID=245187 RepID=A0A1H8BTB3_9RHOB|nr:hypothetical protein [Loktanella fryxellensis]SEM85384.1 protein ImuA [Loktanella fryxellensis]
MDSPLRPASTLCRSPDGDADDGNALPSGVAEPTLAEFFAATVTDGAVTGFVCSQLAAVVASGKPVLWVQDRLTQRETGKPFPPGLPQGLKLILVTVNRAVDVVWSMEEGLNCSAVGAVLGEVWGDPAALDFTATKRLAMRAEAHGIPALLIRRAAQPNLSAARQRWRIASLPARLDPDDNRAPGAALWQADLFRARGRAPGQWVAGPGPAGVVLSHHLHMETGHSPALRATG